VVTETREKAAALEAHVLMPSSPSGDCSSNNSFWEMPLEGPLVLKAKRFE
jgi:hypothetical protein